MTMRTGILGTSMRRTTAVSCQKTAVTPSVPIGMRFERSKYTRNLNKGRLTPKTTPKRGYYKGVGCRSLGFHTRKGGYRIVKAKVPVYVMPDLSDCPLKPYVSWSTKRTVVPPLTLPSGKELPQIE